MTNDYFNDDNARGRRGGRPEGMRRGRPGRGHRGGPGGRMRRGDIRGLVLAGLIDGPAHGYELIQRLEEKTGGLWRPSPGSVYPMLQLLEDAGLVTGSEEDGRKVYSLTEQGRAEADAEKLESFGAERGDGASLLELRKEVHALHSAIQQIGRTGADEQIVKAAEAVREARKAIYLMLAE